MISTARNFGRWNDNARTGRLAAPWFLTQFQPAKRRNVRLTGHVEPFLALKGFEGHPRTRSEQAVDRPGVVAFILQCLLDPPDRFPVGRAQSCRGLVRRLRRQAVRLEYGRQGRDRHGEMVAV